MCVARGALRRVADARSHVIVVGGGALFVQFAEVGGIDSFVVAPVGAELDHAQRVCERALLVRKLAVGPLGGGANNARGAVATPPPPARLVERVRVARLRTGCRRVALSALTRERRTKASIPNPKRAAGLIAGICFAKERSTKDKRFLVPKRAFRSPMEERHEDHLRGVAGRGQEMVVQMVRTLSSALVYPDAGNVPDPAQKKMSQQEKEWPILIGAPDRSNLSQQQPLF